MKVGIYLAYGPAKKHSLINEGLGRYLAAIIASLVSSNNTIIVACPRWLINAIEDLFDDQGIDRENIEFLTPYSESAIYRIFFWLWSKKERKTSKRRFAKVALSVIDRAIFTLVNIKNVILFVALALIGMLLSILFLPIVVFLTIIVSIVFLIMKFIKGVSHKTYFKIKEKFSMYYHTNHQLQYFLKQIRRMVDVQEIKERIRKTSADDLIKLINKLECEADIWYSPTAFFPEFAEIRSPKVLCVPDLVTEKFPYGFVGHGVTSTENVRKTICVNEYFITYSDVVKKDVLINKYGKNNNSIMVIPHVVNNMKKLINVTDFYEKKGYRKNAIEDFCRQNMNRLHMHVINHQNLYLAGETLNKSFCFDDFEYILYPTQIRPNKNILTLVKAFLYLLREKFIPIKLVLTGDIRHVPEVEKFIVENNLTNEILTFYNIDNQLLASLYKKAKLSVNTTLYEGGFPYTFGESLSVETPIVLSDIPQVREVLMDENCQKYLFNPYDYKDVANKILYALENEDKLLETQMKVFNKLNQRTEKNLAEEYIQAFEYFIELSKKDKE